MPARLTPASTRELIHLLILRELAGVRRGGGVIVKGGVRYPTKVEVSFREHHDADQLLVESPSQAVLDVYGLEGPEVGHYALNAAVRQKVEALAGRREAQARDVFDVCVLVPRTPDRALLEFLAENLSVELLEVAYDRVLGINYDEYRGQVIEFLEESQLALRGTEDAWDEMRLRVAALMEATLALSGRA